MAEGHYTELSWKKGVIRKWKREKFLDHLYQNSVSFREGINLISLIEEIRPQLYTDTYKAQAATDLLLSRTIPSNYFANEHISEFIDSVRDILPIELIEKVEAITLYSTSPREPLGRSEQIEKDSALRELLPRFDWASYL